MLQRMLHRSAFKFQAESMLAIFISILTTLWGIACWIASVLGLPGNWGIVGGAALLAWLAPENWAAHMSWATVLGLAALDASRESLVAEHPTATDHVSRIHEPDVGMDKVRSRYAIAIQEGQIGGAGL